MHLPKATRRNVIYVVASLLAVGGIGLAGQRGPISGAEPTEVRATTATAEEAQVQEFAHRAPAGKRDPGEREEAQPRPKVESYIVEDGDSIEKIAAKFGLETTTLLWTNDMGADDILTIGQELLIPSVDGLVYKIQKGDTLWGIAQDTGVSEDVIVTANPELDPAAIQPGQLVLVPGGQQATRSRTVASRGGGTSRPVGRTFDIWPTSGPLTSDFGWRTHPVYGSSSFHDGLDIGVPSGTPLRSVASGTVTMASRHGGYGLMVRIDHGGGIVTQYAHMSQIDVEVGQAVDTGDHIGYSGSTGVSTGPHLHFMVVVNGSPQDPISWLP